MTAGFEMLAACSAQSGGPLLSLEFWRPLLTRLPHPTLVQLHCEIHGPTNMLSLYGWDKRNFRLTTCLCQHYECLAPRNTLGQAHSWILLSGLPLMYHQIFIRW